jgi:hypothetical protein
MVGELPPIEKIKTEIDKISGLVKECYFCGKKDNEVAHLIAGPLAMICSECVELSVDILREHIPGFCTEQTTTKE